MSSHDHFENYRKILEILEQFDLPIEGDFPVFWGIFSINWTEGLKLLITADVFSWSLSESSDNAEMPIILPGRVVGSVTK